MAAIVTDSFRRNNAQFFLSDIAKQNAKYYLGIGKSDKWASDEDILNLNVPTPLGIPSDDSDIKSNLATLIKVNANNSSLVVPHIKWKSGERYKAYSPSDVECFYHSEIEGGPINPCYAVVSGRIYLCLKSGNIPTNGMPTSVDYRATSYGNDGYVWILIDNVSTITANIYTDQFISINSGVVTEAVASTVAADGGGLLYGFSVINGGSDYTAVNSVTFIARNINNTTFSIECPIVTNVTTGAIEKVLLPSNYSYNDASSKNIVDGNFVFSNASLGFGAVIVPHIAPMTGFAYKPSSILPSWYVGISIDAADNISNDGLYIPYRQISVLKDVEYSATSSIDTIAALRYLTLPSSPTNIPSTGDIIKFGTTGITAYFDNFSTVQVNGSAQHRVYFHQNLTTGYGVIPPTGSFTTPSNDTINYTSVNDNEYVPRSGEVIFAENRRKIIRQSAQTEEIKIIIQF
jgi:hypothetical protein